ncbi:MAG: ATP-dependent DNA helicase RecG [Nitrospirae bacterium]|nr:MAG: ATP-dependent DNA helicase RecG [Nitrospirota bacterium]
MDRLKEIIQVIDRPLAFAERGGAVALKDLGRFISRQVTDALAEHVRPSAIEAELLRLAQLFTDYEQLPPRMRAARVTEARAMIVRLDQTVDAPPLTSGRSANRLSDYPIQYIRGVGPKKAEALGRIGIRTVEDAVWMLPWRYEDRSQCRSISSLVPGEAAMIEAQVERTALKVTNFKRRKLVEVAVADRTGRLHLIWFNQAYLEETFHVGQRVMLYGQVKPRNGRWTDLQMENPAFEILTDAVDAHRADLTHMGRIVPIYHARETKSRMMLSDRLRAMMKIIVDQYGQDALEPLPLEMLRRRKLLSFGQAIRQVHFPQPGADLEELNRGRSPAHRRLAFEDFLLLELALGQKREEVKKESRVLTYDLASSLPAQLLTSLPFRLTAAQLRVLQEIRRDLASPHPMNRLIQGDVGSGKTVVAVLAMLAAVGSGYQAALPTEILAEHHYLTLQRMLQPLDLSCVLLTGGRGGKKREAALAAIAEGSAQVVLGTHALIQQDVRFKNLGLAVVDEQHKFGVLQRAVLKKKGYAADVLVMTATPIPRTLALTVYGDLDVSVIDMLPPGRRPVRTLLFAETQRARMYRLVEDELSRGRQAYVVFPLVEESEKIDLQAAMTGAERLQRDVFPNWKVGVIHGRMKAEEKDRVMTAFKDGRIQVLVATTVIEVGIDIANAGVMLIEHADRFGLAQLHQLRGRVGRGPHQSYCFLMAPSRLTEEGRRRLEALVKSHDGFVIAEEDLAIRGPGEFFGTRQWGPADLRVANLIRDAKILEDAREESARLLLNDPELARADHAELKSALLRRWRDKLDLARVS